MATVNAPKNPVANWESLRDEWINRLITLVTSVQGWAEELDWSTRRIEKRLDDSQLGTYQAPALLLQEGTTRVLLEPIARFAPGAEGVVDLYLMPAYDDIATLYFYEDGWHLHYMSPETQVGETTQEANSKRLSKEAFKEVLDEMRTHAA